MKQFIVGLVLTAAMAGQGQATCSGDCRGDGEVTVDELIIGVNIALGSALVSQCSSIDASGDGEVTIDELIAAVTQALNGCTSSVAGDYSGTVTMEAGRYGIINLNVNTSNQANGSLLLTTTAPARSRFQPQLSFSFPVGGASVALSGIYDAIAGGFEVSGSFVDAAGATVAVVISGSTAGLNGTEPVNLYVGSDVFPVTLSPGMFATPTPTPTVTPTPPPGSARIVYAGDVLNRGLFVMNLDGSGKTKITNPPNGLDLHPAWSPNGSQIAFATPYQDNRYVAIGIVNADGSGMRLVGEGEAFLDGNPAWSPDGSKIVFTAGGGDAIDIVGADGSGRRRLLTKQQGEIYGRMSWSPDGSRIVFESTRPRDSGSESRFEIWVMNADGSNLVQLTNNELPDRHPDWSPNGQRIVFTRNNSFSGGVMSINPDGSGEVRLVSDPFGTNAPNWSADGQGLAYGSLLGIKITNANGANAVTVPGTGNLADFDFK